MKPDHELLKRLYGSEEAAAFQEKRLERLAQEFTARFGADTGIRLISAPGRTEIAGNHTDHNLGKVLAASVDLDTVAAVRPAEGMTVTLYSDLYDEPFRVDLTDLEPAADEKQTTSALIRGTAAAMKNAGYKIGGFDAVVTSSVMRGSGLSSSAAFEVLLVKILSVLFNGDAVPAQENARMSKWAENHYFMKPCGLMDQMASAVGGLVYIDFGASPAEVEALSCDFTSAGLCPCVVSAGGDHGSLTDQYAAIPAEMKQAAACLGGTVLRDVEDRIYSGIPLLKGRVPDRAILRALHFADENRRVEAMRAALKARDMPAFLRGVTESGESSWKLLQNLYVPGSDNQEMPLALDLSARILAGEGARRIHGGGFAGTILAFVPFEKTELYRETMESVFGKGSVKPLYIRPVGAVELA